MISVYGWTLSHPSSPVVPGGVVAGHKVLAAVQPGENLRDYRRPLADREIAEMPDFVVRPDDLVPALDNGFVHCRDRREGPPIKAQSPAMPEMRIAGEENRHAVGGAILPRHAASRQRCSKLCVKSASARLSNPEIIRVVALDSGRQSPHVNVTNIYMGGKSCITMFCCGPSD